MSSCNSQFGPKVKHATKTSARKHRQRHQAGTIHQVGIYRCPRCSYWHVGRIPGRKAYRKEQRRERASWDYLVGRLIVGLREAITGRVA